MSTKDAIEFGSQGMSAPKLKEIGWNIRPNESGADVKKFKRERSYLEKQTDNYARQIPIVSFKLHPEA